LLNKHIKTHEADSKGFICPQYACSTSFKRFEQLDEHLEKVHKRIMLVDTLQMKDISELKDWFNNLQETESASYNRRGSSCTYYCNRSSHIKVVSNGKGIRNEKKLGSIRLKHVCTSRVKVVEDNDGLHVTYHKTHSHGVEPGRIGLTSPQKRNIARKVEEGVPKQLVLQKLRGEATELNRARLGNMQDIYNIARKYNLNSEVRLDENDARSLHLTIQQLRNEGDEGVFLYKPSGVISDEYPGVSKDDFLMAYMSKSQEHMLSTYGSDIICMDGTHGTNAYGIELSSLVVLDDQHQGFPVLFFYHNNKSEETYKILFRKLKERVGEISCRIFMSDDEPALFNAWKVMGPVGRKLLCAWHVQRNWRKHLGGMEANLRSDVFGKLLAIMYETDVFTFEQALMSFTRFLASSEKLRKFSDYFTKYYSGRTSEWAYCHRIGARINTNMSIENMHKDIKYNYFHAKPVSRMDDSFHGIREFLKNKQIDRLCSMNRGKVTTKDKDLRKEHKKSLTLDISTVSILEDHWLVSSSKVATKAYKIEAVKDKCMCSTVCPQCMVCIHSFKCDCSGYGVKFIMCKHVHLLARFLKETTNPNWEIEDDATDDLQIDTDIRQEMHQAETRAHLVELSRPINQDLEALKRSASEKFQQALDRATCITSGETLVNSMKAVVARMNCYSTESQDISMPKKLDTRSPNQNLEKQARFTSKKQKPRKSGAGIFVNTDDALKDLVPIRLLPVQEQSSEVIL